MSSKSVKEKIWGRLKYLDFIVVMSIACLTILLLLKAVPKDAGFTGLMTLLSWIFSSQYNKGKE